MRDDGTLVTIVGGYGDAFLALPSIREVARRRGRQQVHLLCPEAHISAFFADLDLNYLPIPPDMETVTAVDLAPLSIQEVISFNVYYPCAVDHLVGEVFASARWRGFFDRYGRLIVRPSALVNKHKRDQYFESWPGSHLQTDGPPPSIEAGESRGCCCFLPKGAPSGGTAVLYSPS